MSDLDFDELERQHKKAAKSGKPHPDDLDFDVLENAYKQKQAADYNRQLLARQPQNPPEEISPRELAMRQEMALASAPPEVRAKIEATKLQPKSTWQKAKESLDEASAEAGQEINQRAMFGLPSRALESARRLGVVGRPEPVQPMPEPNPAWSARQPEDYLPSPQMLAHVPAMATDMAAIGGPMGQVGNRIAQVPQSLARAFGAKEAQLAVRPSLSTAANAMGTGAAYGSTDAAFREQPIGQGALQGAAANLVLSQAPPLIERAGEAIHNQVVRNSLRGVKQMAKKGSLDKSLVQFGKGDPEEGAREMFDFVKRENLEPVFRAKGQNMVSEIERRQDDVWDKQLKPIYETAYAAEPTAGVPIGAVKARINSLVKTKGTNESKLAADVIKEIERRAEEVGGEELPLRSLLGTARDFQAQGHAGVVSYDAPTASKDFARRVGHELRALANERVARIYERNPEAAYTLVSGQRWPRLGLTMRNVNQQPRDVVARDPEIISSQDYLDPDIVRAKLQDGDFDVSLSPEFSYEGGRYRVVLDGHHSLRAAKEAGVKPRFSTAKNGEFVGEELLDGTDEGAAKFLEAHHNTGDSTSEWRNAISDDPVVWGEQTAPSIDPPAAQRINRGQFETPKMATPESYPNRWAQRYENLQDYVEDVPRMLAEGNKRYSDYAKLTPLVREAGKLKAGEKKFGLMSMLEHGGTGLAVGALGGYAHGLSGALGAVGTLEAGRAAYPYVLRAGDAAGRFLGGPAVNPSLVGAYSGRLAVPTLQQAFGNAGGPDTALPAEFRPGNP